MSKILSREFFDQPADELARALLGKVIYRRHRNIWLQVQIIDTEAYFLSEKASHASLGYTDKRRALFMPPGTIYMYYARGGDSLNISARGSGNAVLIKSGRVANTCDAEAVNTMKKLNPIKASGRMRQEHRLCSGQTLVCKSLDLKVPEWDGKVFDPDVFYIGEGIRVARSDIVVSRRLGIPSGRDDHLLLRFSDGRYRSACTRPLPMTPPSNDV